MVDITGRSRTVFVLSGELLSTVFIPDTEEVTGSIPVSPTNESPRDAGGFVVCEDDRATVRATDPGRFGRLDRCHAGRADEPARSLHPDRRSALPARRRGSRYADRQGVVCNG